MSTAFRPTFSATRRTPEAPNALAIRKIVDLHMGREHVREAPDLAAAHRVRLAGDREGPAPGLPMRPVARRQLMIALTLSVPDEDWLTPGCKP